MRNHWEEIRLKIKAASADRARSRFAEAVGVQPNTVKAWVEGTVPGIDKLEPIAKALGLSVAELLSVSPAGQPAEPPTITRIISKLRTLEPHELGAVEALIDGLIPLNPARVAAAAKKPKDDPTP